MPRTLIVGDQAEAYRQLLEPLVLPDWDARYCADAGAASEQLDGVEILFGPPDACVPLLPGAGSLRWLQSSWAGVTPLIDSSRRDYQLTGVKGIFGELMREYVLGWLLALERNIISRSQAVAWQPEQDGMLAGKTLGIMGTGSIGSAVAKTAKSFGLHTRGLNSDGRSCEWFDSCYDSANAVRFAKGLDYLVALLPATQATRGCVSFEVLNALNASAIFINAGRANCVHVKDLEKTLRSGRLRAAVLDVLDTEPLPLDDPLWKVDNLYITSHTAAPTLAEAVVGVFADNYRRYVAGDELLYGVDFEQGY